jgi:hypothetical protein
MATKTAVRKREASRKRKLSIGDAPASTGAGEPLRVQLQRAVVAAFAGADVAAALPVALAFSAADLPTLAYRILTRRADRVLGPADDAASLGSVGITAQERPFIKVDANAVLEAIGALKRVTPTEIGGVGSVGDFIALFVKKGTP